MLPDSLKNLFEQAGDGSFPRKGESNHALAAVVYANLAQANLLRSTSAHFARRHGLNLIDFHVLLEIAEAAGERHTVTPGYISETFALSASTLTSILERLAVGGFLHRDRDVADKRRISMKVTPEAAKLILEYYRAVGQIYDAVFTDETKLREALACTDRFAGANRSLFEAIRDDII